MFLPLDGEAGIDLKGADFSTRKLKPEYRGARVLRSKIRYVVPRNGCTIFGTRPLANSKMRIVEEIRAAVSLLAAGLPWVERAYQVLPVSQRAREDALPAAALATILCVIAGYATTRHSTQGLNVGWTSLVLFLAAVVALFGFIDLFPRGERGLYILSFALFGLSAASFLSLRREDVARW